GHQGGGHQGVVGFAVLEAAGAAGRHPPRHRGHHGHVGPAESPADRGHRRAPEGRDDPPVADPRGRHGGGGRHSRGALVSSEKLYYRTKTARGTTAETPGSVESP